MTLFLISFHDLGEELGGCIMRASSEEEALAKVTKARFAPQVGLRQHGRVLVTEMNPAPAALVPERFIDRLLVDDEIDRVYELIRPAALIPEGPALEAVTDHMVAQIDEGIAHDRENLGRNNERGKDDAKKDEK
jgi:hypothetical protein